MKDTILQREKELLEKEKRQLQREADAELVAEMKEALTMEAEVYREMKVQTTFLKSIQTNVLFFAVILVIQIVVGVFWALNFAFAS